MPRTGFVCGLRLVGDLPSGTPVAFEVAFGWGWLVQLLEDYGFEAHLVHPLRCKAIASDRLKNDKGRRRDLGAAAPRGPAPGSVDRPAAGAAAPRAAAAAGQPVRLGAANRIHAVAADRGYDRSASYWTGPGRGWLAELDLVTGCLAVIDGLAPVTGRIDGELHAHAKAGPRVKILRTLPGFGEFTALVMLAEIGDISRFATG